MKMVLAMFVTALLLYPPSHGALATENVGAAGFEAFCAECHASGGNTVYPAKTVHGATLRANGIITPQDIIRLMRHPGPGMPRFDPRELPDREARAIAEYVLSTFK